MYVKRPFGLRNGFTLIETLAVAGVIAVLVVIGMVAWQPLIARAEGVQCLSHMKSLHTSLVAYVQDNGHWPQEPDAGDENKDIDADWWINELKPYGGTEEVWLCPTIKRAQLSLPISERWKIHYSPGMFGPLASDPYKYSMQPWLIEISGMHGRGPNICFPDGSIRQHDDFLKKKSP